MKKINIAIDGPAGAGKSTVAKLVAKELAYIYVDTGAMYRALTFQALEEGIDVHDGPALAQLLTRSNLQIKPARNGQSVWMNEKEITEQIRSREVSNQVSFVASHPEVRQKLLAIQVDLAGQKGVVMDGRDIGTQVLPGSEVKIYLTASLEERAKRRYAELVQKGENTSLEVLLEEMKQRDQLDMNRKTAPLRKADDAIEINSTHLTVEEVVEKIVQIALTESQIPSKKA